ncbi:casparian strip membrane protein 1-like [Durio zibethinus]|uniref:CASP-like protein n=1 Tax=Durio zibethinus TaxID=66656 RepID=A0A6P5XEQ7_DURZI|nr:casparian strip membrane protein 1-like [Durio zibethinus]
MYISFTLLCLAISFIKNYSKPWSSKEGKICSNRMKTGPLEPGEASNEATKAKLRISGVAILEFILRILAAAGTLGSAMAMGTAEETVPLFSQSILLNAEYNDLPMFTFFVIANSVACAYLVLSLPLSFYHVIRRAAKNSRIILVMFDTVKMIAMLALVTSGASTAAAIVYLAHKGNADANCICADTDNHFISHCYLPMLKFHSTVRSASLGFFRTLPTFQTSLQKSINFRSDHKK